MITPDLWAKRWANAVEDLAAVRAENIRLRMELNKLNRDTEELLSRAGQGGIETAKTWLIKQQRQTIRRYKEQLKDTA